MCGITGFISHSDFDKKRTLDGMSRKLRHRGPDDHGVFCDPDQGVYLAHRRLSIIDLSEAGRQPLANEDGSVQTVVNGEIYNYRHIKQQLEALGHRFRSNSDSEVLVHGFETWGETVFKRIEGIYAAAIWDGNTQTLYLARDPLGVKPLVYLKNRDGLFFSSEARAFHALPNSIFNPVFNRDALHQLVCFQYIYEPHQTAYESVRKVPPGTLMAYSYNELRQSTFWQLQVRKTENMTESQLLRNTEEMLHKAVHSQMVADVPVGILLSGGLDSSVIAALAQKNQQEPIWTFTAGFEHQWDERPYAREVARHLGTRHREVMIDPAEINRRLDELVPKLDDLSSLDGGMFTTFLISEKIAEQGIKVLLVGEGADEIFGGYSWFGLSRQPFSLMGDFLRSTAFYYCISRMLPTPLNIRHIRRIWRILSTGQDGDIFRAITRFEVTRQLPNHFLMKVDHGTMAKGIEARVPYLDRELVETVYNLPGELKLLGKQFTFGQGMEKYALRRIAGKLLPDGIAGRGKRGFSIPMPEVLQSNYEKMQELLLADDSVARHFFSKPALKWLMGFKPAMYAPYQKHREFLCWRLLLIEIWRRHYSVRLP